MAYFYLFIAITSEVIATSSLKASAGFTKLYPSIVVVMGYTISFIMLSLVLQTLPVGIAYACWAGLGIFFVTIAGYFLYGQKLDIFAISGISLIIVGVLVINIFSETARSNC
ncbi:DMT family transporter [Candidatus Palibaumannia cicadellinicola]|uniref:Ethidium bromide-methyl viologen resistance protein EmrE multidrug / betaine / choline efflux transporter n=1 Tax=Candidatus Palibaumannia cicadellinicola TaxID=186490 RepID=A0A088MXG1_9GAMM|nr:multidrug efflux SMR transporter [Candidatus Baumannia cicadellinicola]AIN46982.1 Ethidium bromide-methyl viologen resistance protein EmrE; multidrug / betaine / choline efflux transporter [Candidatus Baumannia cicadellinicola]